MTLQNTLYLKLKSEFVKYADKNTLKTLWLLLTIAGGFIFVFYYINIQYLPNLNIKDSIQLIVLASITSLVILVLCLLLFVAPGIVWSLTLYKRNSFRRIWYDKNAKQGKLFTLVLWLFMPSLICYALIVCGFKYWYIFLILLAINYLYLLFKYLTIHNRQSIHKRKTEIRNIKLCYFGQFLLISILNHFILLYPFAFIYKLSSEDYLNKNVLGSMQVATIILLFCICIFVNAVSILKPKTISSFYWYVSWSLILFFLTVLSYGELSFVPGRVMEIYKFGNFDASIILD